MGDSDSSSTSLADEYADLTQLFEDPTRTSQEVVRSVFDIKLNEAKTYLVLLEHSSGRVDDIADVVDRDRSHTARALRGLHDAGLVNRQKQHFEDTGGMGWVYNPVPIEEMKQYLEDHLNEWVSHVESEIETFDSDIKTDLACDGGADDCSQETEDVNDAP